MIPSDSISGGRRSLAALILRTVATVLLAVLAPGGCRRATAPAPESAGQRVVSLAPNITEIVDAIGAGSQLVGRSSACDYPPDLVKRVPVVGDFGVPSLERLVSVSPDLVLYADLADNSLAGRLERAGLHHARVRCTRMEEIAPSIRLVGILLHRLPVAKALAADIERLIRETRANLPPPDQRPSCLVLIWNDPLTAAGRNSFLSDLVTLAGLRNIGDEIDRDYFQVSGEWVLARDPDIILCFMMTGQTSVREWLAKQPGWDRLKAMRNGRVLTEFDNNLMLRPGPRIMEGLSSLKAAVAAAPAPPVP